MSPHPTITILKPSRSGPAESVTLKQYLRKTARGKVQKILREHYLRIDIPCGSSNCQDCTRRKGHKKFTDGHYLMIDTNVILRQIDLLESSAFGSDLIIPQTVFDEVRHRSLPIFNRLKALINETDQSGRYARGWVFWNEAHLETHLKRESTESINDRNDRAIRQLCQWYTDHLSDHPIRIVLLSDDRGNREKALESGLLVSTTKEYVEGMKENESVVLTELIAASGTEFDSGESSDPRTQKNRMSIYEDYLSMSDLNAGLSLKSLYQGKFRTNQYNYLEGSIFHPEFEKPILLIGKEAMNRSIDGDDVVVELLPEDEWKTSTDEVVVDHDLPNAAEDPDDDAEPIDTQDRTTPEIGNPKEPQSSTHSRQPTGKVVGILKRNWRPYVCHLDPSSIPPSALQSSLSAYAVFATPLSRLIPKIRIRTRQAATLANQKVLISIDSWDVNSRYPEGHFVRALGVVESKEAEQESLLLEFDVPYRPFSQAILDCLPESGDKWVVPEKTSSSKLWKDREDFRNLMICSIDPPGCQDIDDALHAKKLSNGNIEVGVHIADVSHFVLPDTPMDFEAASRGTTVYLVDKRIDMLPSLLGTNLCSLKPYVERLAFSVIWELSPETSEFVNVRFTRSVIQSKAAFTYEEAQNRKDNKELSDEITESIRLLNDLAIKLKAARMRAGALNLASPEVKIQMESSESSDPVDVEQKEARETNSLVEEFMLLANISVAKRIYESFPLTAVLRRHNPPPKTNFEVLQDVLMKRRGMVLDSSSSGALANSLDNCIDPEWPTFNTLVRIMATRCMLPAEYFASGSVSKDTYGHYGLASPIYTHFTSPIRRYADVLVHRQLSAAITQSPLPSSMTSKPHVERIMTNINKRHNSAQKAGRASVEFYVALAIKAKELGHAGVKVRAEAFVIRAFRNGLAVFVSQYGLEGLIKFKNENEYDADRYEITIPTRSEDKKVIIGIFDRVMVEITTEQDRFTQRGRVKMSLIEPIESEKL
ncbi:uncharacterized protein MELLADRAFT_54248 [Melampsora larici-populina 98AG31]|uniref:Ribosomal RNA-processing protein 44 n=1 Tax=Melampsora larici-populina (strain 98AG31 / pathotype 3-4-7) TaxID=747676 RepID=F4SAY9_MELLP|nr:uncharacterized protein MELLADRAFT_54248 [Melampsora larici-populina 98AG31]EGF98200.1 hypothetical protein MELLADRAFT_54248 [Melampsora larici-populina 98AG31]